VQRGGGGVETDRQRADLVQVTTGAATGVKYRAVVDLHPEPLEPGRRRRHLSAGTSARRSARRWRRCRCPQRHGCTARTARVSSPPWQASPMESSVEVLQAPVSSLVDFGVEGRRPLMAQSWPGTAAPSSSAAAAAIVGCRSLVALSRGPAEAFGSPWPISHAGRGAARHQNWIGPLGSNSITMPGTLAHVVDLGSRKAGQDRAGRSALRSARQ
jgi:hypothetical protein